MTPEEYAEQWADLDAQCSADEIDGKQLYFLTEGLFRAAMNDARKEALLSAIDTAKNFNSGLVVTALRNKLAKLEESK